MKISDFNETSPYELVKRWASKTSQPRQYEKAAQTLHNVLVKKSRDGNINHSLGYYAQQIGKSFAGIDYRALVDYYKEHYGAEGLAEFKIVKPDTKDTMGIKRNQMPQVATKDYPEFLDYLKDNGATFTKDIVPADSLKAIQGEFSDQGVEKALRLSKIEKPIIASNDNYIIDGHHRWLAALNTGVEVNIFRVDIPGKQLLQLVKDFPKTTYKDIYTERLVKIDKKGPKNLKKLDKTSRYEKRKAMMRAPDDLQEEATDPILSFIQDKEKTHELSYGNCGVLAIVLDQKFDMDEFIFVTNPAEPDKLYHVAAVKGGKIYDADGITNLANVRARGLDDDYPDEDPEVENVPAVESEYRYILQGTDPDIGIEDLNEGPQDFADMKLDSNKLQQSLDYFYKDHAPNKIGGRKEVGAFKGYNIVTFTKGPDTLMFLVDKDDQAVFYVAYRPVKDGVAVGNVRSNGSVRATEVYAHLVSKFGTLYSDDKQTPQGRKIWADLAKFFPDISVTDTGDRLQATNKVSDQSVKEATDIVNIPAGHILLSDYAKEHISTHNEPGIGSVFSKNINLQKLVDVMQDIPVQGEGGAYTINLPGAGYNLVLPIKDAKSLPDAQLGTVNKQERGPVEVPAVKTSAPIEQFATNEITVIVRPSNPAYLPDDVKQNKQVLDAIKQGKSYSVITAFPGGELPPASQWNGKYAVIIPNASLAEAKEIEFVCVNPAHDDATKQHEQDALFQALKDVPGVIVYRQDFDIHNSMAAILKSNADVKEIKALAKKHNVKIDLTKNVSDRFIDSLYTGDLEGVTDWYDSDNLNEADEVIPMLYHATYKPFLDSIMKNGLGGKGAQTQWEDSKPGYVYLAKDPEVAVSHAEANEEVPDEYIDNIVVLSIDASQLDQDNLEDDPNVMDDDSTLAYKGIIPTSAFSVNESSSKDNYGIPDGATLAQLDKIAKTAKNPEKRERAHWLRNMRRGKNKK